MFQSVAYENQVGLLFFKGVSLILLSGALLIYVACCSSSWLDMFCLAIYFLLLIWNYKFGFFFLPALLPILDFGIFTGNILYNEYDICFLLSSAFILWRLGGKAKVRFKYDFLFFVILAWFLFCTSIGFLDYIDNYQVDDIYQSPFNGLRVGKGFLAAGLAWYVIRLGLANSYVETLSLLGSGILVGSFMLSLEVLWERHVFSTIIYPSSLYDFFSTLLDFSSTYRITGFFSGMHVGGTALDGYLVCVLPIVFYIVNKQRIPLYWTGALFIFMLGLYSLVVTFTRMTIASFAVSLAFSALLLVLASRKSSRSKKSGSAGIVYSLIIFVAVGILSLTQQKAGYQALFVTSIVFVGSILLVYLGTGKNKFFLVILPLLFGVSSYSIIDSIRDSKWHQDVMMVDAIIIAISISLTLILLGVGAGLLMRIKGTGLRSLGIALVIGAGFMVLITGMGSTRMTERMGGVSSDFEIRAKHWHDVISSAQTDSAWRYIAGFGMGSMPKLYYQSHFDKMALPSYRWIDEDGISLLQVGRGGYPFFQKIMLEPNSEYKLTARVKFEDEVGILGLDICHKHIIFSEQWQPDCVKRDFRLNNSEWNVVNWTFNSGNLGRHGWWDWPPTIQMHNYGKSVLSVDSLTIVDATGRQIIKNFNFDNRLAYWFWVSDFEHLPWHSKQLFIQIWLEQGWIGVLLMVALISLGIRHQWQLLNLGETIPIALLPSMFAVMGLGLTDEFIDEPQTTLMVFTVLFAALQWPQKPEGFTSTNAC